jgi:RNA polymerase sigma-70 factor (ECF subfamily)
MNFAIGRSFDTNGPNLQPEMNNPGTVIEHYQPLLQQIAQNILGSVEDAKDIVQDTFLKWLSMEKTHIENPKAYLIRAVRNNALSYAETVNKKKQKIFSDFDGLQARIEEWYRESEWSELDFEDELAAAMLVLQTKLEPVERAVFLMKEVFNFDYDTIQEAVDKRKDNLRQIVSRAKKKLEDAKVKPSIPSQLSLKKPEFLQQLGDYLKDFHLAGSMPTLHMPELIRREGKSRD